MDDINGAAETAVSRSGGGIMCLVTQVDKIRNSDRGEDAKYGDDNHHLDQCEACLLVSFFGIGQVRLALISAYRQNQIEAYKNNLWSACQVIQSKICRVF